MINIPFITQKIHVFCEKEWLFHSRVQHLPSFSSENANVFVKREDESGFGISGTKKRKYASLLSFILMKKPDNVRIIGGENSNNVVGLLQLLNENKIETFCYIKKQKGKNLVGNGFLFHLLVKPENIIYVENEDWEKVNEIAENDAKQSEKSSFIVKEGASQKEAVAGASTLMLDILQNETEKQLFFNHIFIDSGTGLTAAALANMNFLLGGKSHIHVVHTAGDETSFSEQLLMCQTFMQGLLQTKINPTENIFHYFPETDKSFGAVNATILQFIHEFAQTEGILTDPVYTAKLFFSAKKIIERKALTGNILLIHGGGGTGLMGFSGAFPNLGG
jgi:1-aminocyclopropane-1-carboxylate deaminase/D-cysteine desulfhydrase-like pyridoxal-dependent ACC family enzyme